MRPVFDSQFPDHFGECCSGSIYVSDEFLYLFCCMPRPALSEEFMFGNESAFGTAAKVRRRDETT